MNAILCIVAGGVTGWWTGKWIGEDYGKNVLGTGYTPGLDITFGIVGAALGGCLFVWALVGEVSPFSFYATAVVGSVTLVAFARLSRTFPGMRLRPGK